MLTVKRTTYLSSALSRTRKAMADGPSHDAPVLGPPPTPSPVSLIGPLRDAVELPVAPFPTPVPRCHHSEGHSSASPPECFEYRSDPPNDGHRRCRRLALALCGLLLVLVGVVVGVTVPVALTRNGTDFETVDEQSPEFDGNTTDWQEISNRTDYPRYVPLRWGHKARHITNVYLWVQTGWHRSASTDSAGLGFRFFYRHQYFGITRLRDPQRINRGKGLLWSWSALLPLYVTPEEITRVELTNRGTDGWAFTHVFVWARCYDGVPHSRLCVVLGTQARGWIGGPFQPDI